MPAKEYISSTTNPKVKWLRGLYQRASRYEERAFPLEGVRLVSDALRSGVIPIMALYDPARLPETNRGGELLSILQESAWAFPVIPKVLASVTDTVNPQGVVAATPFLSPPPVVPGPQFLGLVLDGLQDPGNLGTLLRTAEAAAVDALWLTPSTVDLYNPKVVRAAMGAHFRLSCYYGISLVEIRHVLGKLPLIATAAHGIQPYYKYDWRGGCALLVGNEANGVSAEAYSFSQATVTIPMPGQAESLNVATATAIILFEALRQRH